MFIINKMERITMDSQLTFERLIKFDLFDEAVKNNQTQDFKKTFELLGLIHQIKSMDQFIKDSPSYPGSTDKIIRGEMISAIGSTLAIEGINLNGDEIEESFQKATEGESLSRKEQEAENSRKVYNFIRTICHRYRSEFKYSEQIIMEIHKLFTQELNYLSNIPGEYRGEYNVTFGHPRKQSLCKNKSMVEEAMRKFIDRLNAPLSENYLTDPIIKAIMSHYYLTEIHPFSDGNGRVARALEALILYENGVNGYCFWSLANFWSTHRDLYLDHLAKIRTTQNPIEFILWGLNGFLEEITKIKNKVLKKVKQLMLMDYTKYLLEHKYKQEVKINKRILELVRLLIKFDTIEDAEWLNSPLVNALYSKKSNTTKFRDFKKMVELELLRIETKKDKEKERRFFSPNYPILDRLRYNVD